MSVARVTRATLLLSALTVGRLVLCTPALAQSAAQSQYVEEGVEAAADNAGQGTDAVNEAMSGTESSAGPASTSPAASPGGGAKGENGDDGPNAGPGSITRLPKTGGASLVALCSGILLVMVGPLIHKLGGR